MDIETVLLHFPFFFSLLFFLISRFSLCSKFVYLTFFNCYLCMHTHTSNENSMYLMKRLKLVHSKMKQNVQCYIYFIQKCVFQLLIHTPLFFSIFSVQNQVRRAHPAPDSAKELLPMAPRTNHTKHIGFKLKVERHLPTAPFFLSAPKAPQPGDEATSPFSIPILTQNRKATNKPIFKTRSIIRKIKGHSTPHLSTRSKQ